MMHIHKIADCVVGGCGMLLGLFSDGALGHFEVVGGAILIAWRLVQTFILEPMGIFWPRPKPRKVLNK